METKRLLIRSVQMGDVDSLHEGIFCDPELMRAGIYLGRPLSYSESVSFIEGMCSPRVDQRYISPSVFLLKGIDELVGFGGLSTETDWGDLYRTTQHRLDAELFYVLKKVYWGQGLATEMAKAVIDDALTRRGVDRVWASVSSANNASQRVSEKAGMVLKKDVLEADQRVYLYERTHHKEI